MLGGTFSLTTLIEQWQITNGKVIMGCDNRSALFYAFDLEKYPYIDPENPDFDVLGSIRSVMIPGVTYTPKHIKGHQDALKVHLDIYALLNIHANKLANIRRGHWTQRPDDTVSQNIRYPGETWQLHASTNKICRSLQFNINDHISRNLMKTMWIRRNKLTEETFQKIDWDAIQAAMKDVKTSKRHWIAKHSIEECGVNTVLVKRKEKKSDLCKRCGEVETTTHVWQCQEQKSQEIWTTSVEQLGLWLHNMKTEPRITQEITCYLLQWYYNQAPLQQTVPFSDGVASQTQIGWRFLIEGWLSKDWRTQQQLYWDQNNISKSSLRWATAIIKKLWDVAWDLWEHRNGIEHEHDVAEEHQELNNRIAQEIESFENVQHSSYDYMFSEDELIKVQNSTLGYKRLWLQNVAAAKLREGRRAINRTTLQGMQDNMRAFLRSR